MWSKNFIGACNASQALEQPLPELIATAVQIVGEGFDDMRDVEVLELVQHQHEKLTPEEIEVILEEPDDSNVADDDGNLLEEIITAKFIAEILNHFNEGIEKAVNIGPIMTRSLKLKHECEKLLWPYEELYRDLVRRSRQSRMTELIQKY
ncbi:hypothetical protein QAD02_003737 [Eretmocerus hayati]|uniref:Uncharacterized protein n=1 Tax=Eretmocerus hayati TaxID=131215 RepID=A0ACC2NNN1_9HYME|nr:hypothetical protein QAD02_003737 [Eretmocerus hayati]